jgi:hypothetical protein
VNRRACQFSTWLAGATFTAVTRLVVVHWTILTGLRTTRLVCGETHCANRGRQDREQDFETILHNQRSSPALAKASEKRERRSNLRTE